MPSEGWNHMMARGMGASWAYAVGGGESGWITQSPTNPDVFYAGSQGALLTRYNRKTGQRRDIQVYPRFSRVNHLARYQKGGNGPSLLCSLHLILIRCIRFHSMFGRLPMMAKLGKN